MSESPNMVAYFVVQYQMSGIHAGIQASHALAELFLKYKNQDSTEQMMLDIWAKQYKTIVILNGGYQRNLETLYKMLEESGIEGLPFAKFHESEDASNGLLTCVGLVLPDTSKNLTSIPTDYFKADRFSSVATYLNTLRLQN